MDIAMPYGQDILTEEASWLRVLAVLDVADVPEASQTEQTIRNALHAPIGLDRSLQEIVSPRDTVAIVVSDAYRNTCVDQVLPVLLDTFAAAGVPDEAITLLFATGTHRPPTADEQIRILGREAFRRLQPRIVVHDPWDQAGHVHLGVTSRGTPVKINRRALEADRLIVTGAVVLHYFAGYGGGRKSVVPGIAAVDTIAHNHALNLDPRQDRLHPNVRIGVIEGNPVAEDIREAADFVKVDFLINTVLNRQGRLAAVFAGDIDAAHRAAAAFARRLYAVPVAEQADLVIASASEGKNFVQSHKALYNAYQAVRPEGRIIFCARCEEGLGGEQFVKWLRLRNREAIIAGLRQQAEINGQTALSTIEKAPRTIFVTELSFEDVALLGGIKAKSLSHALDLARDMLTPRARAAPTVYLLPSAGYTVPFLPPHT